VTEKIRGARRLEWTSVGVRDIWVGMSEWKKQVARHRSRWNHKSKLNLKEIFCGDVDSIYL
jgi:hypothetical protein